MGLGNDSSSSSENNDPLRYPLASGRFGTLWIKEGDDNFYLSLKLETLVAGDLHASFSGTDRSQSFLNQVGQTWKEEAEGGGQ